MLFKHVRPRSYPNDKLYFEGVDLGTEKLFGLSKEKAVWIYWPIPLNDDRFRSSPPKSYTFLLSKVSGRILEKYVGCVDGIPERFREVIHEEF